jgi:hypothetical protein
VATTGGGAEVEEEGRPRSFIGGLGAADDDTTIVRSVIAMAHGLGLAALAEGRRDP